MLLGVCPFVFLLGCNRSTDIGAVYPSEASQGFLKKLESGGGIPKTTIPEQRAGRIEDMAGAILFLTSRAGGYLNGNVLVTDGGRLGLVPSTY